MTSLTLKDEVGDGGEGMRKFLSLSLFLENYSLSTKIYSSHLGGTHFYGFILR